MHQNLNVMQEQLEKIITAHKKKETEIRSQQALLVTTLTEQRDAEYKRLNGKLKIREGLLEEAKVKELKTKAELTA